MNGRLEDEIKKEKKIENGLKDMPEFVTDWYYHLKASDLTVTSRDVMINTLKRFLLSIRPDIKSMRVTDITRTDVNKYMSSIQTKTVAVGENIIKKPTSDSYKQGIWYCLNNFFDYFTEAGEFDKNYMNTIKKKKNHDLARINEHRVLLTSDDFKKIIEAVDKDNDMTAIRDKAILLLMMGTGIRETALTEINLQDLNMDDRTLSVTDKGDKPHLYVINDVTADAMVEWLDLRDHYMRWKKPTDALFLSQIGNRLSVPALRNLVGKYTKKALGKVLSPHKLRAGFCSILYNQTHDLEFVSRAVGHSDINVTRRYIVTDNNEKDKSSGIINNIFK